MQGGENSLRRLIAVNIRARRKALGWSQEALAHEASCHRTFIGHVERAETNLSIDNLERISSALGVHACELICSDRNDPGQCSVVSRADQRSAGAAAEPPET